MMLLIGWHLGKGFSIGDLPDLQWHHRNRSVKLWHECMCRVVSSQRRRACITCSRTSVSCHRQTVPCKNTGTLKIQNCYISSLFHALLFGPLYLGYVTQFVDTEVLYFCITLLYYLRNRRWGGCVYVLQMFFLFSFLSIKKWEMEFASLYNGG